ncbi:hypothetical protein FOFC_17437 [Fusarium oxysporum]|nr:hypothetical protein FOFC_17437 [Fusarium oxysporum]
MRLQRSVMQLPSCKMGSEPCGARASRSGHQRTQKVEQLRAAGVVRAAKAAEVGRTGENRGRRARIVEGSRSRNVDVRRNRK